MVVADHWEDEADQNYSSDARTTTEQSHEQRGDLDVQSHPFESVAAPSAGVLRDRGTNGRQNLSTYRGNGDTPSLIVEENERRPDKTTSVAARLIASGLGQKAQKRTQEERDYDRAVRALATKRRNQARVEKMEAEAKAQEAKTAMWED